MYTNSKLRREDGKEFRCVDNAHWSLIEAVDGEQFRVKWWGGNDYISPDGIKFKLLEDE